MDSNDMIKETYRLSLDNNRMLHKMRRNAFFGSILRVLLYLGFLLIPVWLYMTYLAPMVDQMLNTVQQIQGTSAEAKAQFTSFQEAWKQFQDKLPFSQ